MSPLCGHQYRNVSAFANMFVGHFSTMITTGKPDYLLV